MLIFTMLLLAGVTIALAVLPLLKPSQEDGPASYFGEDEKELWQRKKEVVYGNIKDLDFEYRMGKLGEEDYQSLRQELKLEAALLLERIDRLKGRQNLDDQLEKEIQARRARLSPASAR